jgi:hypothetical protein
MMISFTMLIAVGTLLAVIAVGILLSIINAWSGANSKSGYNWKPDLSSKIIDPMSLSDGYPTVGAFGDSNITFLAKSAEELDEERHAYLKERKSYD